MKFLDVLYKVTRVRVTGAVIFLSRHRLNPPVVSWPDGYSERMSVHSHITTDNFIT